MIKGLMMHITTTLTTTTTAATTKSTTTSALNCKAKKIVFAHRTIVLKKDNYFTDNKINVLWNSFDSNKII